MLKVTKRRSHVVLGVIAALVVAAAAIAYWTAGGSGVGTASTSDPTDQLTVKQTGTLTAMFPGDSAQTLSGNFDNPTGNMVRVDTVTASIDSVTQAPGAVGSCDATDYTLTGAAMSVNAEIPSGTGQGNWTGAKIKFNDKPSVNQDGCKGATVNLAYAIS